MRKVDDLVADFLYYDRKEDEDLPPGAIEQAMADNEIHPAVIVARFAQGLTAAENRTGVAMKTQLDEAAEMYPICAFFKHGHLPPALRDVAERFAVLALEMATATWSNPQETAAGLRKLVEAKDCMVRAASCG